MTNPLKIIVLTDLHICAPGEAIIGLDPTARLLAVLTQALTEHPDAAEIIFTGDLTHYGRPEDYTALISALPANSPPIHLMLGNHDRRAPFLAAFPDAPTTPQGHVQQHIDLPGWRLILLDTLDDPQTGTEHSGLLCDARLRWLDHALATAGPRKTIVFAHHPPFDTGFDGMDAIKLRDGPELMARLAAAGVHLLVCGHIHRTIFSVTGGVACAVFKSPCHQMPLALGPASIHLSVDEPGAYGLLLLREDGVVVHSQDVF